MKSRTLFALAVMITMLAGCFEGAERDERDERPEDDAAEAAEISGGYEAEEGGMLELPTELLSRAEVTVEAALATALARVPGGEVAAGELEEEDGKLIFSFDVRVDGRDGIEEVHVDALSGAVIGVEHEGAEEEDAEAARR